MLVIRGGDAAPQPAVSQAPAGAFLGWIIPTLHLIGVELEKEGDDFGLVRVVRKAIGDRP